MKGMKRKFFLKRMWNFVVVMLIPALLLVAVTTYMTFVTQMHRMTQDNERGIEAVRSNISLVLDSVLAQNSYMTGMTRTNMVLNKALKRESLSYTDAIYLRSLVSSLNSMTNAYDYVDSVLRGQMGFDGYINSDTGIAHNMAWGVEMLDVPERIGFAVANAGVDIISGLFDNEAGMEAYNRGKNGYYETHPLPEGFAKEELTLTDEALDRAVARTLTELFALGMFENPYRDPDEAARIVATPSDWEAAADAHRRSVVLLKNDGTLPLTADKRANKKIYAEAFLKNAKHAADSTAALRKELADTCTLVDDPAQADFALLFVSPSSGEYFNATPGYLELDICEDKTVCNVDANGKPMADTHTETTLHGGKRLAEIAASVHANGGKVITNVNITLAWQLGNVEPLCDVLLAGFDTYRSATLDVIFGCFAPTGKLPLTLPRGDAVLAVNADGVCISPNDVPGYDKDRYMPDSLKDENGKAYAYRDAAGNYYEYGFGLEG